MKIFILISFLFYGFGFSQSRVKYDVKKISFEQQQIVIDSVEWKKEMQEFYNGLQPMSDALFQSLGLEREEPMISFEELMDSIKPSEDNFEKYKRFFIYETINDSIIQRYDLHQDINVRRVRLI